jgi:DNA modification methylase
MAWTNLESPARIYKRNPLSSGDYKNRAHKTQKPVSLMLWVLENYSKIGDTIFDPFMGSGTTGVACMQLGRNFIGCEIDPNYYAIAEKRIKEAASQQVMFA